MWSCLSSFLACQPISFTLNKLSLSVNLSPLFSIFCFFSSFVFSTFHSSFNNHQSSFVLLLLFLLMRHLSPHFTVPPVHNTSTPWSPPLSSTSITHQRHHDAQLTQKIAYFSNIHINFICASPYNPTNNILPLPSTAEPHMTNPFIHHFKHHIRPLSLLFSL